MLIKAHVGGKNQKLAIAILPHNKTWYFCKNIINKLNSTTNKNKIPLIKALPIKRRGARENTVIPNTMESTKAIKEIIAYRFMGRPKIVILLFDLKYFRLKLSSY